MFRLSNNRIPDHKLAFILSVVTILVCAGSIRAQPLKEIRIASSTTIGYTNLSTFYARDRKFFEKEGFDAKIIIVQSSAALAALVAGNVDYTTLSTTAIEAALRGMPLRVIAVTVQYPVQGLVVPKEVMQVADLKGRKIGVSSYGGTMYGTLVSVLKYYGVNPKDVTILAIGNPMARVVALKNRSVDATIMSMPEDMKVTALGDFKILLDVGPIDRLPSGGISTTLKKIRENPAEVQSVVRAVVGATRFLKDPKNRDEAMKYFTGDAFKLGRGPAEQFYRRLVPSLSAAGMVDKDKIKLVINSALERGLTDKPLEPDMVVDFSFVKQLGS